METVRGKVIKGGRDSKGRVRKYIEIPSLFYDDFEFGDKVRIEKVKIES